MPVSPEESVEKNTRADEIIAVAERIFTQKGFERASMDEIAAEAGLTKRTVYKYFFSKEELYFGVVLKGLRLLMQHFQAATERGGSGLEKLRRVGAAYLQFYKVNPDVFRLINYSQFVANPGAKSGYYPEIARLGAGMFQRFNAFVLEGKADGSIRPDLSESKGVFALFFFVTGFFFRLSEAGPSYSAVYGIDPDDLAGYAIGLLMDAVKQT
jgi:AcrR family transcriptional regulator